MITFGGFILENIERAIIQDCVESGDPVHYWRALRFAVSHLEDDYLLSKWDDKELEWFESVVKKYSLDGER